MRSFLTHLLARGVVGKLPLRRGKTYLRLVDAYLRLGDVISDNKYHSQRTTCDYTHGGSKLHDAVAAGDAIRAAQLLASGIDISLTNVQGLQALCREFAPPVLVHAIRQQYQLMSEPGYETALSEDPVLNKLRTQGIVKLSGFVQGNELKTLTKDLNRFANRLDDRVQRNTGYFQRYHEREHFWPESKAYISNNAFGESKTLLHIACRPKLLEWNQSYFNTPVQIQRAKAMRYLSGGTMGHRMFKWHHDLEGRRLKLFILLSEVTDEDHTMGYVCRSHTIMHPWHRFHSNRLSLGYCKRQLGELDIIQTTGQPGDAYLFDSNGAHVGNRRAGARTRDVFFVEYNPDRSNVYGMEVPGDYLEGLNNNQREAFSTLLSSTPRWHKTHKPGSTSWVQSLYEPDRWLARFNRYNSKEL